MFSDVKPETNADVQRAFAIDDLQIFHNANGFPYAVVGGNRATKVISDRWLGGFDALHEFRDVLEFICEQFEAGDYRFWLADLRLLNTGFFHSDDWLAGHVFPRAIKAGLEREAVVLPARRDKPMQYDVFGSGSSALKKITDGRVRGFTDIDEAKSWLFRREPEPEKR